MNTILFPSLAALSPLHFLSAFHFSFQLPAPVLAAADVGGSIDSFMDFVQKILILPALALVLYAAWMFHENRLRDAGMALGGALLLGLAVPIVKAIFGF
jgi:hypothetical protein